MSFKKDSRNSLLQNLKMKTGTFKWMVLEYPNTLTYICADIVAHGKSEILRVSDATTTPYSIKFTPHLSGQIRSWHRDIHKLLSRTVHLTEPPLKMRVCGPHKHLPIGCGMVQANIGYIRSPAAHHVVASLLAHVDVCILASTSVMDSRSVAG